MALNSPWEVPCVKGNLKYMTPDSSALEIDTQQNLNKLLYSSEQSAKRMR
jgi:hypothetical protein